MGDDRPEHGALQGQSVGLVLLRRPEQLRVLRPTKIRGRRGCGRRNEPSQSLVDVRSALVPANDREGVDHRLAQRRHRSGQRRTQLASHLRRQRQQQQHLGDPLGVTLMRQMASRGIASHHRQGLLRNVDTVAYRLDEGDEFVGASISSQRVGPLLGDRRRQARPKRERCPQVGRPSRIGDPAAGFRRAVQRRSPGMAELCELTDPRHQRTAVEREERHLGPERDALLRRSAGRARRLAELLEERRRDACAHLRRIHTGTRDRRGRQHPRCHGDRLPRVDQRKPASLHDTATSRLDLPAVDHVHKRPMEELGARAGQVAWIVAAHRDQGKDDDRQRRTAEGGVAVRWTSRSIRGARRSTARVTPPGQPHAESRLSSPRGGPADAAPVQAVPTVARPRSRQGA